MGANSSQGPSGGFRENHPPADERPPFQVTLEGVPIELVLTAARGRLLLEVDELPGAGLEAASFRIDEGPWDPLDRVGRRWRRVVSTADFGPGEHHLEVMGALPSGDHPKVEGVFRIRTGPA